MNDQIKRSLWSPTPSYLSTWRIPYRENFYRYEIILCSHSDIVSSCGLRPLSSDNRIQDHSLSEKLSRQYNSVQYNEW
ncbi:hypothetical protein J6590_024805 [Homalodisca vitripennis]|nr:hypothetical protein J6590_024805 [Homalodisca vitripennis]